MAGKGLMHWDPFRTIGRWDPFNELREMQREMDRIFDRLGRNVASGEHFGGWLPSVESYIKDNHLTLKCELPGVDPKDVDVHLDENTRQLIIRGERKTEKDTKQEEYIHKELIYGTFERRLALPEGVKADQVRAKFTNGILEITAPVSGPAKAKKIEIETAKAIEGAKKAA